MVQQGKNNSLGSCLPFIPQTPPKLGSISVGIFKICCCFCPHIILLSKVSPVVLHLDQLAFSRWVFVCSFKLFFNHYYFIFMPPSPGKPWALWACSQVMLEELCPEQGQLCPGRAPARRARLSGLSRASHLLLRPLVPPSKGPSPRWIVTS